LVLAALLWPIAVALSRLALRGQGLLVARERVSWAGAWVRSVLPALPGRERPARPERPTAPASTEPDGGRTRRRDRAKATPAAPPPTVNRLLDGKRRRAAGDAPEEREDP
jgi:hypothetical protein